MYRLFCKRVDSEDLDLSYRDDLRAFKRDREKHKKGVFFAAKITVVLLAIAFLATAASFIVDMVGKDSGSVDGGGSGGGASGGGRDTKPPVIELAKGSDAIFVYVGENVSWKTAVKVTDDSGNYELKIDNSDVNLDAVGIYEVVYTATDGSGNKTEFVAKVVVNKREYSYDALMSYIKTKAESLGITAEMSKRDKVEKIYEYANAIAYNKSGSNIPSIDRDNWETDWVEEAMRTFSEEKGDCYSYYSVSKAFFEYFDIENVGIQRDNSEIPSKEGTHFWFVVNIGEGNSKQWYYYDATRLNGKFSDGTKNACLITLSKLQSYTPSSSLGYDFYEFDPTKYPTAATK